MGYLGYWMGGGQANYHYAGIIISWAAFAAAMVQRALPGPAPLSISE